MTDYSDLVKRLREHAENMYVDFLNEAADAIELLQRELKCANELWEQQKELALEYLADIEKANERIAELEAVLKSFAYYAEQIPDDVSDTASASGTVGDLRRAREVLGEEE